MLNCNCYEWFRTWCIYLLGMVSACLPLLCCDIVASQDWQLANSFDQRRFSHCYFGLPEGVAKLWFAALPELQVHVDKQEKNSQAQLMHRCPPQKLKELRQWHGHARAAVQTAAIALLEHLNKLENQKKKDDLKRYLRAFFWISPRVAFNPQIYPREELRMFAGCLQELRNTEAQRREWFSMCVRKTGKPYRSKGMRLEDLPDQPEKYKKQLEQIAKLPCILGEGFERLEKRLKQLLQRGLQDAQTEASL